MQPEGFSEQNLLLSTSGEKRNQWRCEWIDDVLLKLCPEGQLDSITVSLWSLQRKPWSRRWRITRQASIAVKQPRSSNTIACHSSTDKLRELWTGEKTTRLNGKLATLKPRRLEGLRVWEDFRHFSLVCVAFQIYVKLTREFMKYDNEYKNTFSSNMHTW